MGVRGPNKVKNEIGQKIGKLTLLHSEVDGFRTKWYCLCECGNSKWMWQGYLRDNRFKNKSCGCSQGSRPEFPQEEIDRRLTKTKPCLYCNQPIQIWRIFPNIKDRPDFPRDVGKHKNFCSPWCSANYIAENPDQYQYAIESRKKTGSKNLPTIPIIVTAFGESKSIKEWSRDPRCRVTYPGLQARFKNKSQKWSAEQCITTPPSDKYRKPRQEKRALALLNAMTEAVQRLGE